MTRVIVEPVLLRLYLEEGFIISISDFFLLLLAEGCRWIVTGLPYHAIGGGVQLRPSCQFLEILFHSMVRGGVYGYSFNLSS